MPPCRLIGARGRSTIETTCELRHFSRGRRVWAAAIIFFASSRPVPVWVPAAWLVCGPGGSAAGEPGCRLLIRMVAETAQHAGNADIIRELIDGTGGPDQDSIDEATWREYLSAVQVAAEAFRS